MPILLFLINLAALIYLMMPNDADVQAQDQAPVEKTKEAEQKETLKACIKLDN